MKHKLFYKLNHWKCICMLSGLLLIVTIPDGKAQQTAKMTPEGVGYLEHLPPDYAANPTKQYPCLIFLHGNGERGDGSPSGLQAAKKWGPPKLIESGHTMCFTVNGVQECFIVITPQLPNPTNSGDWWPAKMGPIFDFILNGSQNYRIDKSRVYVTGISLGGNGVYNAIGSGSDIFAAGAAVSGYGNGGDQPCVISGRKVPIWAFHGQNDSYDGYSALYRISWCDSPKYTAELKWTSYPGVGHDDGCWSRAYSTDHSVQSPLNLYEWLLTKRKSIGTNLPPTANAGIDKIITLPINNLTISGTGTDADGTVAYYVWTKVSGGAATLTNTITSTLSVTGLVAGSYTFRLTVSDNLGLTASDDVIVTVNSAANTAPAANAGTDKIITLPVNSLSILGTGTDTDGTIASYAWTKVSGAYATLNNAATSTLSVTGLVAGSYTFRLTVTDNLGLTASDDVNVTVNSAANTAPVANAGTDKIITLPINNLSISGTGTDADGFIASYAWTKVSGIYATLTNTTTSTLSLTGLVAGSYTFRLTVTDNLGLTASDDVNVTVNSAINTAPVANAGTDKIITLPTNSISFFGTGTDFDGNIAAYAWTKISGATATLNNATTSTLSVTGLVAGSYTFRLTVIDNLGLTASDDVNVIVNPVPGANIQTPKLTSDGTGYLEYLPADYATNTSRKYPLLIFLHGVNEKGDGSPAQLERVKANGPPKLIEAGHNMCFTVAGVEECFIVLSPQLKPAAGDDWWPLKLEPIFKYILTGPQNYRIDKSRVYLTGVDIGGQGVYLGLGGSDVSDVFAAGAVVSGKGDSYPCSISARKIPVWGFHGQSDTVKNYKYGEGWTEFHRISWCTAPVPTAELPWTSYPGVGHNESYVKAYSADHSVQSPNLYEWLLSKRKVLPGAALRQSIGEEDELVFFNKTYSGTDHIVTIYNGGINRVFNGNWRQEYFNEVFSEGGLYYYKIAKNNKYIDSGKLFINR